jgi:hypothetical protein
MKAAVTKRWQNFDTVDAFRADDKNAEVEFTAVGFPRYTLKFAYM